VINISSIGRSPAFYGAAIIIFNFAFMAGNNDSITIEVMAVYVI